MRYFPAYAKFRYSLLVRQDLQIGNYMFISMMAVFFLAVNGVDIIIMLWPCIMLWPGLITFVSAIDQSTHAQSTQLFVEKSCP